LSNNNTHDDRIFIHHELFFDDNIGWMELHQYPQFPDMIFLNADYYLDITKSANLRLVDEIAFEVFETLRDIGLTQVFCSAASQSAFNFNERLGFKSIGMVFDDVTEVMVKGL